MIGRHKRILVDMDGVIADFNGYAAQRWNELYSNTDLPLITREDHIDFDVDENYQRLYGDWSVDIVGDIYTSVGFTYNIPEVPGAINALEEMLEDGNQVFIVTSPMLSFYQHQLNEKYDWIKEHLSLDWLNRLILTRDKTVVSGDFLIDDKPRITGVDRHPSWEHIIFDQPYNRHVIGKKRLINWDEWRNVLEI